MIPNVSSVSWRKDEQDDGIRKSVDCTLVFSLFNVLVKKTVLVSRML